jgi:mannitol-1-phosphate 5-dehydrogenase
MTERTAVVFGAGKIARGFIAHLLTLSGFRIQFVEKSPALAHLLRTRGCYGVHIMGAPEKDIVIENFEVLTPDEEQAVAGAVAATSVVFVSIGGPNLPQIAPLVAAGIRQAILAKRAEPLNVILCENYFHPAELLRNSVAALLTAEERKWLTRQVGIVETMVLRSTIEPTEKMKAEDPLALKAQDMWEMPADKEAFVGEVPPVQGLSPKLNFQGGLVRKLFTYNAANAVISYMGYLKGYTLLSEAANDPDLAELARAATRESGEALCRKFGFDPEEQRQFAESAIAKYQKSEIVDPIERNTRDPLRKLRRNDRLVGPACLAAEQGIRPEALSRGIAAGLHYDYRDDESARKLQQLIRERGPNAAVKEVCEIDPESELGALILREYHRLTKAASA